MFPGHTGEVNLWVDKGSELVLVHPDPIIYIYCHIFSLFSIKSFQVLGKLPGKVRVAGHLSALLFGHVVVDVDHGNFARFFVDHPNGEYAGSTAKHHAPAQSMALFCPQHIIFEEMMPERKCNLY